MERKVENAKIIKTMLGYEDHGIMTAYLTLDYAGSGQGFGGWVLGNEFLDVFIKRTLKTVGVETWESLVGKYIQADHDWGKVYGIRNILGEGDWFYPEKEFAKIKEK